MVERACGNGDKNIDIVCRQCFGECLRFLDDGAALVNSTHETAPEPRRDAPDGSVTRQLPQPLDRKLAVDVLTDAAVIVVIIVDVEIIFGRDGGDRVQT
ncbi:MAG: hypothetical protein CMM59_03520 [Rhodospirillaceae bacterium]|nr:hypothetical protein [Rhodospirillaceae bacterium]